MAGKSRQLVFEATAYIVGKKRIMDAWAQLAPCFFFSVQDPVPGVCHS